MQMGASRSRSVPRLGWSRGGTGPNAATRLTLRRLLALSSATVLLLGSRLALAQADSALARALFRQGRALMDQGDYAQACPKFEESLRQDAGIGTQFNLAHCWQKAGRTASAWALFLDVAAAARAQGMTDRAEVSRARADALEPSLTRLKIVVPAARGLRVKLDGKDLNEAAWATEIPVDPGPHVVVASARSKRDWSMTVGAPPEPGTVLVRVPELADSAEAQPVPEQRAPQSSAGTAGPGVAERKAGAHETWSWIIGGLGVAALAGGVVLRVEMKSSIHAAEHLCNGGPEGNQCVRDRPADPAAAWDGGEAEKRQWEQLASDSRRERVLSYAGFGVGAAAAVTSLVLFLVADGSTDSKETSPLSFYPDGAGGFRGSLSLRF
jgi:hypothetical protein